MGQRLKDVVVFLEMGKNCLIYRWIFGSTLTIDLIKESVDLFKDRRFLLWASKWITQLLML